MIKRIRKVLIRLGLVIVILMMIISGLLLVFKDNIKDYALEEVNKYLNKRVHIGYIDIGIWRSFPNMSMTFDDVLIHSRFGDEQTKDTALYAKKITLRFDVGGLLGGDYTVKKMDVEDAVFNMVIKPDGKVNYDFLKESTSDEPTKFEFSLEEINIVNTRYRYKNEATDQDYDASVNDMQLSGHFTEENFTMNSIMDFQVNKIQNKSLVLLTNKHATCDIAIAMNQVDKIFEITSADLNINQLPFQINGKVTADSMAFYIGAEKLNLVEVTKNFTLQELDVVNELNGDGDVSFKLNIDGPLSNTSSPAIEADFSIEKGSLSDATFSAQKIFAKGHYSNGVKSRGENLAISDLRFTTTGSSFEGKVDITDFEKPRFKGFAKGGLNLKMIHRIFGPFGMDDLEGNINLNGNFDLRFNDLKYEPQNITIYNLRSQLELHNIKAKLEGDDRLFSLPSGELVVRNQQAVFKSVQVRFEGSDVEIDGTFNKIADYFMRTGDLVIDAAVESHYLDLNKLSSESTSTSRKWLLPNNIRGGINLLLDEVVYGGHTYSEIRSRMVFERYGLRFPFLRGINSNANINGSLIIEETRPMFLNVKAKLNSDNIQFAPLFKNWNNFEQETIKAENIIGEAAMSLTFEGPFDLFTGADLKEQFKADVDITVNNGALVNVSTFREITNSLRGSAAKMVIPKSRINELENELLNLKFKQLNNHLRIREGVLYIPKMEIQSNALDIRLKGQHSFDNIIDYSFDFRFREVLGAKKSEFGDVVDDGSGFRVFLRMYGDLDNLHYEWDKEAKKADRQEKRDEAKDDLKSVLKSGFGINKGDTTIKELPTTKPTEKIFIEFEKDSINEKELEPEERNKRKSKLREKIDQWKKESEEETEKLEFD
jgi:hypothetical protein